MFAVCQPLNSALKVQLLPGEKDCLLTRLTLTYDSESDTYSPLVLK